MQDRIDQVLGPVNAGETVAMDRWSQAVCPARRSRSSEARDNSSGQTRGHVSPTMSPARLRAEGSAARHTAHRTRFSTPRASGAVKLYPMRKRGGLEDAAFGDLFADFHPAWMDDPAILPRIFGGLPSLTALVRDSRAVCESEGCCGVTSTSSSGPIYSNANSSVISRGGVSTTASSVPDARMLRQVLLPCTRSRPDLRPGCSGPRPCPDRPRRRGR